jgi:hypothetical protein
MDENDFRPTEKFSFFVNIIYCNDVGMNLLFVWTNAHMSIAYGCMYVCMYVRMYAVCSMYINICVLSSVA